MGLNLGGMSTHPQHAHTPIAQPSIAQPSAGLASPPATALASWDNVSVSWRGRRLLRGFSHTASTGGIVGVIGAGGRAMDITLVTLAARRTPTSGTIAIEGAPGSVAIASLASQSIDDPLTTVGDSLRTVTTHSLHASRSEVSTWAAHTTGSLELATRTWLDLSPGQRVRAGLACALASGAPVIVVNAADVSTPAEMAGVWTAITQLALTGRLVIVGWPTPSTNMSATATMLDAAPEGHR